MVRVLASARSGLFSCFISRICRPSSSARLSSSSLRAAGYIKSHARRLADIMTRDVVNVSESATLGEIADLMEARRIKRVPVAHDGKLVGIVSRADLLRVLGSGGANPPDDEGDRSIRS